MGGFRALIVLDTSAWIWWISDPGRLSRKARVAIESEENGGTLVVSVISAWEIALKHGLGKLELDRDLHSWLVLAAGYPGLRVASLEMEDAVQSTLLPGRIHRAPADRFLIALARRLECPLVTSDTRLRAYRHVRTLW